MTTLKLTAFRFIPIILSALAIFYISDPFDPAPFPVQDHDLTIPAKPPSLVNANILDHSHFIGSSDFLGPEDLAYDHLSNLLYTGCNDGWIKRINLNDSVVHNWAHTGGRPLGIALTGSEVIVADAYQGLLRIGEDRKVEVLTSEAGGVKFKMTDGVDVAKDGMIYFTDASYRYHVHEYLSDMLEGRPHGRLLSFDPSTGITEVLLEDLYFPNGVAISPDQMSLVFCETPLKRCRRYWLQGSKKGNSEAFVDNLPGYPDNIHCDAHNYWIGIASSLHPYLEQATKLQSVRKATVIIEKYISLLKHAQRKGGVYGVNLQGNPTAHYYDPALSSITCGIKINNHMYLGSLNYSHIIRFNISTS